MLEPKIEVPKRTKSLVMSTPEGPPKRGYNVAHLGHKVALYSGANKAKTTNANFCETAVAESRSGQKVSDGLGGRWRGAYSRHD